MQDNTFNLGKSALTLRDIDMLQHSGATVLLSEEGRIRIDRCRAYLDEKQSEESSFIYGVNTGFGALCDTLIAPDELRQLQVNLVRSHAAGVGARTPSTIARLMLLLKADSLAQGYSGCTVETVERLLYFYNHNLVPYIPQQGSLGASGDLAPLAHMSLPLIGEGHFLGKKGKLVPAIDVLRKHSLKPLQLYSKEGLALLNGTQFMCAYGVKLYLEGSALLKQANATAALSFDAFSCRPQPLHPLIHRVRPHKGQAQVAEEMLEWLRGSELLYQRKQQVQDPYSYRCTPQVHGAVYGVMEHLREVIDTELASVTDNPLIFADEDEVLSGGNFHGEPLALVLDYAKMAIAELGNISERRIYKLMNGGRELPLFLVANPGLNSGFMIAQYTAAAIVSENKVLTHPSSTDSITSSNGQEDHVSMGANAARHAYRVLLNVEKILAIEWLAATQALDFRAPAKTTGYALEKLRQAWRNHQSFIKEDVAMHPPIMKALHYWRRERRQW